jgi:hypothetical protein
MASRLITARLAAQDLVPHDEKELAKTFLEGSAAAPQA